MKFGPLVGAIHEGINTVRFIIFKADTDEIICYHQLDVPQIYPKEGWIEQDPMIILLNVIECIGRSLDNLRSLGGSSKDIVAIGITNQRETTVLWDKQCGLPLHNAILCLDKRTLTTVESMLDQVPNNTRDENYLKQKCGLPISTYFSALKIRWLIDNVPGVIKSINNGTCLFGTIDTWVIWNLTGATDGGLHITDVTNASRTMLMNIKTTKWDPFLLNFFDIPKAILPEIKSSSELYGKTKLLEFLHCPITSCLGDQQAALVGQQCFEKGQTNCSYSDTDCFVLCNTGKAVIDSRVGILTTVAYQFGNSTPMYAIEGNIPFAEAGINWLIKNMALTTLNTCEEDARKVPDCGNVYFVPAFSGIYTPYWDQSARGIIVGLSDHTQNAHIIRASLEAICFQVYDMLNVITKDLRGIKIKKLVVDGCITENKLLLQMQSDLTGIDVVLPNMGYTTALGAAIAAYRGITEGNIEIIIASHSYTIYKPKLSEKDRKIKYDKWREAASRSLDWISTSYS